VSIRSVRRSSWSSSLSASFWIGLAVALSTAPASAQMGGMGPGGMPNAPMGGQQAPKEEGPAQQAPEEAAAPEDLEPLAGYTNQNKRRAQLFELNGYFRLRSDYMHQLSLNQGYSNKVPIDPVTGGTTTGVNVGLPPFPRPSNCRSPGNQVQMGGYSGCGHKDLADSNIRFRLEPTLNVTDQVRIHSQFDVLDNTILGSTPDSLAGLDRSASSVIPQAPIPFLYNSQGAPEVGQNGYMSSIRAKRAWAEVDTEFGSLRFGRMPWHFGRGITYNDGSCMDCDGGTTVDRIALLTEMYGHQFTLALDYGSQGLTSNQLALGRIGADGVPLDLAQDDDVYEFMFSVTHIDNATQIRERVDRGDVVLNYGLQLVYRSQHSTYDTSQCNGAAQQMAACTGQVTTQDQALPLTDINAFFFQPNVWFKLQYKALTIEFEGTALLGRMDKGGILLASTEQNQPAYFRQFGGVLASELHLYRDAFFVGFEAGGASGDQAENESAYLNYRWRFVQQPAGDHSIRDFHFSPEYHIDSILFRNILGTVSNAIYFKPAVAYWFDLAQGRQLGLNGTVIYSLAQVPVSTPGNSLQYGLETNVGVTYRNTAEGFYAGMTWGVLWPFGALDRPSPLWSDGQGAANADAAQILRGFLGVKF